MITREIFKTFYQPIIDNFLRIDNTIEDPLLYSLNYVYGNCSNLIGIFIQKKYYDKYKDFYKKGIPEIKFKFERTIDFSGESTILMEYVIEE